MHKSIFMYAKALRCTPGHVRRYIREGKIPSARLIPSRFGRPSWSIGDCSPRAIADLKTRIVGHRKFRAPVIFHQPAQPRLVREPRNGKTTLRAEIIWHPMWRSLRSYDAVHGLHDIITRLAMLSEGLSWHDVRNPCSTLDLAGRRRIAPLDKEKIQAFEKKRRDWLKAWLLRDPMNSFVFEFDRKRRAWARKWISPASEPDRDRVRKLFANVNRANVMQAAEYLALYHRRYDVPITYQTLAQVLGISKTSLYRQYGRKLVQDALWGARSAAKSPTQGTISARNELE